MSLRYACGMEKNNKTEQQLGSIEIGIKNLEKSVADIPRIIAKAVEEFALMAARGFQEVHEKMGVYRKEVNARFDRIELFNGIRDDMRL